MLSLLQHEYHWITWEDLLWERSRTCLWHCIACCLYHKSYYHGAQKAPCKSILSLLTTKIVEYIYTDKPQPLQKYFYYLTATAGATPINFRRAWFERKWSQAHRMNLRGAMNLCSTMTTYWPFQSLERPHQGLTPPSFCPPVWSYLFDSVKVPLWIATSWNLKIRPCFSLAILLHSVCWNNPGFHVENLSDS